MKSVKCPECGFVGWADAERCKKCGVIRLPDPDGDAYESAPEYHQYQPGNTYYSDGKLKTGLAVASLVIGIVDLFTFGLLGIGAIVGITLSIVALSKAKRHPHEYGGKSLATAGLVLSIISVVMIVPLGIVTAIAIPNLLASRRAANEASSLSSLRRIHSAQETYQATTGNGQFGTIDQLIEGKLLGPELGRPSHHGYKFTVTVTDGVYGETAPGFEAVAVPETYGSSGVRSFYVDETGIIRAANNRGAVATELDDPLEYEQFSSTSPPQLRYNARDY